MILKYEGNTEKTACSLKANKDNNPNGSSMITMLLVLLIAFLL